MLPHPVPLEIGTGPRDQGNSHRRVLAGPKLPIYDRTKISIVVKGFFSKAADARSRHSVPLAAFG